MNLPKLREDAAPLSETDILHGRLAIPGDNGSISSQGLFGGVEACILQGD